MSESRGVWGIEIGQAGLKAIRLRYAEAAEQVIAVAFDYVPHPKILSQPDAVPEELIPQALETFLSRNDIQGDAIAISVPGQSALARFIQLPPVEASKVAEIVKYEARQQIPFALEDVIWDYQPLGGGTEESGYMLEAEVGLFAMKREQVLQQLKPFLASKVEVELIQIAPLALYNFLSYDRLGIRLDADDEEAGETPEDEHTIVLDMGADNTTLLVSNGAKIWIRNVPIGGNHFTRALTKEMKLTFAKAEHLKCNATKSPDPRAVFQALRPVFNDYVSEIQRSIGYFSSVNRDAKIVRVLGLGNGFKLAGLQKFLQQNLQYDVERVESFDGLVGDAVLGAPLFQENILGFGVPYGLALQGLKLTRIRTSLLPPEIATARKIRQKKPWAVAAAATLLVGFSLSAAGYANVWHSVSRDRFGSAEDQAQQLTTEVSGLKSEYQSAQSTFESIQARGDQLVENLETREYWLQVYKAINECLPRDQEDQLDETDITKRHRIKLPSITAQRVPDLGTWFESVRPAARDYMLDEDKENPPTGPGYVFTIEGVHYHHEEDNPTRGQGVRYVVETLLNNLQKWEVQQEGVPIPVRKLGITHPTIVRSFPKEMVPFQKGGGNNARGLPSVPGGGPGGFNPNPGFPQPGIPGGRPPGQRIDLEGDEEEVKMIPRTKFTLEFVWKPTPDSERLSEQPSETGDEGEEMPAPEE